MLAQGCVWLVRPRKRMIRRAGWCCMAEIPRQFVVVIASVIDVVPILDNDNDNDNDNDQRRSRNICTVALGGRARDAVADERAGSPRDASGLVEDSHLNVEYSAISIPQNGDVPRRVAR